MAEPVVIKAAPRTVLGKKVASLRRNGRLPANVYGKGIDSRAVELDAREFQRTIKSAGLRAMFQLDIDGEKQPRYVILRGMDRRGGTGEAIHIDFFQVDPDQPIHANVPLRLVGDAPAVRDLAGMLLAGAEMVAVICRPLDIPDALEVDVSSLTSFDMSLTVADVKAPPDVEILTDPSVVVATVSAPRIRAASDEDEEAAAPADETAPDDDSPDPE